MAAVNLGVYPLDDTVRIMFSTAAADGGEENFSATLEQADIVVRKDGSNMTLDALSIVINAVATGVYEIVIDTSVDADFTAGSEYWVYLDASDETIDLQAVSSILGVFWIETALERSLGLMAAIHTNSTVGATGNDTTHVHLDGITSTIGDNEINGELLLLYDLSATEYHYAVVTAFVNTGDLATVESLQGGVLPFTPANGDSWWRVAPGVTSRLATQAKADVNAQALDVLNTDTYAEPGQGTPGATLSLAAKINYLYKGWRNRKTQTSTTWSLYNDDATTVDQKSTVSDNGTTADKTEITTGP